MTNRTNARLLRAGETIGNGWSAIHSVLKDDKGAYIFQLDGATLYERLTLLRRMVLGVLGEVAMRARLLDETGRRRTFHGFQVIDLILEGFVPPGCHRYSFHGLSIHHRHRGDRSWDP